MASTYGDVGITVFPDDILQTTPTFAIGYSPNVGVDIIPPTSVLVSVNANNGDILFG